MTNAKRDENHVTSMLWVSSSDSSVTVPVQINPVTGRMKVDITWWGWSWDVVWPASAVNNNIATFDTTTGKLIQDWGSTIAQVKDRANHTGTQTMSTISDAWALATLDTVDTAQIDNDAVTLDKIQNIATNRVLARSTAWVWSVEDLTLPAFRSLINVEDWADVTDTANVTAAGALMDSEVTNLAQVKAFDSSDYATAAQWTKADSALQINPALWTPTSWVMTNVTGTASWLTAGTATVANWLKSATTTVSVSSSTAPTTWQVLTAIDSTTADWQTPWGGWGGGFTLLDSSNLWVAATSLTSWTFTAVNNLIIRIFIPSTDSAASGANGVIRFNWDTWNNYGYYNSVNGWTPAWASSATFIRMKNIAATPIANVSSQYHCVDVSNLSGQNKFLNIQSAWRNTSSTGIFETNESVGIWWDTSQVTSITLTTFDWTALMAAWTRIDVYGQD